MTSTRDNGTQTPTRWLDWQRCRHRSRRDYAEYQYQAARGRLPEIARQIGRSNPKILDVGCGLGGMSAAYAADGGRVTAVDEGLYDNESIRFIDDYIKLPWYHLLPRSLVRATLRFCEPRGFLFLLPTLPLMRVPYVQELFLEGLRATLQKTDGKVR